MYWMLLPLKRYFDFSGRSRRKEYWMFILGFAILVCAVLGIQIGMGAEESLTSDTLILLVSLPLIIPSVAVQVRRFHDQNKSGWLVLLGLIPFVGGLIVLVFMCLEGTRGENRFGPDPKDPVGDIGDVFA